MRRTHIGINALRVRLIHLFVIPLLSMNPPVHRSLESSITPLPGRAARSLLG